MSSEKCTAICLNAIDYKENDKLLTLYAKGKGKLTATLRGCKSPKSKLKVAGSPLCLAEYELTLTRGRYVVTGISDAEIFYNLWSDLDKFYIASTMLEVFNKFIIENEIYDDVFLELLKSLNALSCDNSENEKILVQYLFKVTSLLGYAPFLDGCVKCGDEHLDDKKFSIIDGGLVCNECGNGISLNSEVIDIFQKLNGDDINSFFECDYSKNNLFNVIFIFSKYIEQILGEKVKSLCQILDNLM